MANKSESVKIRLDPDEKNVFQKTAALAGLSFSAWVRERLRRAARLELEEAGGKPPFFGHGQDVDLNLIEKPDQLQKAVEKSLNCTAQLVETVRVVETSQGKTVWEGTVFVFDLKGHVQAKRCYAWASSLEGSAKVRHYAALHIPPIDSPEKAVRAAMIREPKMQSGFKKEKQGK